MMQNSSLCFKRVTFGAAHQGRNCSSPESPPCAVTTGFAEAAGNEESIRVGSKVTGQQRFLCTSSQRAKDILYLQFVESNGKIELAVWMMGQSALPEPVEDISLVSTFSLEEIRTWRAFPTHPTDSKSAFTVCGNATAQSQPQDPQAWFHTLTESYLSNAQQNQWARGLTRRKMFVHTKTFMTLQFLTKQTVPVIINLSSHFLLKGEWGLQCSQRYGRLIPYSLFWASDSKNWHKTLMVILKFYHDSLFHIGITRICFTILTFRHNSFCSDHSEFRSYKTSTATLPIKSHRTPN